ncbi:hypothetical protein [Rhodococcoides kyotonense]|uniref:Integral membrane protein n=1 Tax=Rhodococcoides kyotonense TaxID=398843 RepID=A0A239JWE8_9NOCA|nr:hypothetical protein [Rhodococcus kyotonensis]SNT10276.1 hypothetical protein SAMN05421642_109121 [Rhodococcus kyotonensis]
MITTETATRLTYDLPMRRLYLVRFGFALLWAVVLVSSSPSVGPVLTTVLVVYPLFDAAAVLWQVRSHRGAQSSHLAERINIAVSILVAVAVGWASTVSLSSALVVWGLWAVGSGIPQLLTAMRNRRSGGQVFQMVSGGLSVVAGAGFVVQGLNGADTITGIGGYAALGGIFFLISAVLMGNRPSATTW